MSTDLDEQIQLLRKDINDYTRAVAKLEQGFGVYKEPVLKGLQATLTSLEATLAKFESQRSISSKN